MATTANGKATISTAKLTLAL